MENFDRIVDTAKAIHPYLGLAATIGQIAYSAYQYLDTRDTELEEALDKIRQAANENRELTWDEIDEAQAKTERALERWKAA